MNPEIRLFQREIQRSEEKRIVILLGVTLISVLMIAIRNRMGGAVMQGESLRVALTLVSAIFVYFTSLFLWVRRANQRDQLLPEAVWAFCAFVESWVPTLCLVLVIQKSGLDPLVAATAPAILLYGIFIFSNILRLRARLTALSAILAVVGYVLVIFLAVHKKGEVEPSYLPFLATYPLNLLMSGALAVFISRHLKKHVVTALQAAELRKKAELLQSELKIAREIQQTLFPKENLDIPGFEVVGWCKPATETGGDYYDWCKLPSEEGFVMLGDATGHGLGPALLIASCRAYVRADLPQNMDLSTFMNRLNQRLSRDTEGARFVTFVGALIDEKTGSVKIISAGHCPVLILRALNGKIEQVLAHSIPLGMVAEHTYPDAESFDLQQGDRLVVYTDGISEARRADGEMFGTDRLTQSVIRHHGLEGQAFIDALYHDLKEFLAGVDLQDDLTLLSVRRREI